jgi:photosystem II stability/assembly factor-like uncharacterized protein
MGWRGSFVVWIVAGIAVASVWSSAPAGAVNAGRSGWSWGNPLPQGNDLRALEFIGDRGYAAGEFGTLLRSDDAGASWKGLATGVTRDLTRIAVIDSDSLVIAGDCAVRRSDDGGESFDRLPWTASELDCRQPVVAVSFPSDQVGYVLIADGDVFRTADGGRTWSRKTAVPGTRATGGPVLPTDIGYASPETGLATTAAGRIYRTIDAGTSWTLVRAHPQALRGISLVDSRTAYVVGDATSVLRSSDGGATWTQVAGGTLSITSLRCADVNRCVATVDPGDRLLRTTDGWASFTSVTPSTEKILAVAFASTFRAIAAGALGATVTSNDAGATWMSGDESLDEELTHLRAQSGDLAFAAGRNGALARTSDGGATWTRLGVATSADVIDASFPTDQTGFALDSMGSLLRTDNGGTSWQILDPGTSRAPLAVLALDPDRIFLIGPRGMRRSSDGGEEFDAVRGRRVSKAVLFDFDRARCLFAFGSRELLVSSTSGESWKRVRLPQVPIIDVDFVSCNRGFVLTRDGRLYRTRNRGRRWKELFGLGPNVFDISFSSRNRGYAASNLVGRPPGAYVLRTFDGGLTWRPEFVHHDEIKAERPLVSVGGKSHADTALLLAGDDSLFTTVGGEVGRTSSLRLDAVKRRLRRPGPVKVSGRLAPAEGGEQVVLLVREAAEPDWRQRTVTAASNGRFSTTWNVGRRSFVVAQWVGDDERAGDGSTPVEIRFRRR